MTERPIPRSIWAGKKRDFEWRLETPERGARAGVSKTGNWGTSWACRLAHGSGTPCRPYAVPDAGILALDGIDLAPPASSGGVRHQPNASGFGS